MNATFALLLLAHAAADFLLQSRRMALNKRDPLQLLLHALIVLVTAQCALGQFAAWPLLALAMAHAAIDAIKARLPATLSTFLADQAAHLATLLATATLAPGLFATGLWAGATWLPGTAALFAGAILATTAGGYAMAALMARFTAEDLPRGLADGGRVIGLLERGLIFVLVLVNQPAGIGFLIAAKSILRFDTASHNQKAGEYVIIGTLASFGWALIAAYATLALAQALPPLGILPPLP